MLQRHSVSAFIAGIMHTLPRALLRLLVQDDSQKGLVNFDFAVVLNET